jgi:hypothetical protein
MSNLCDSDVNALLPGEVSLPCVAKKKSAEVVVVDSNEP